MLRGRGEGGRGEGREMGDLERARSSVRGAEKENIGERQKERLGVL